MEVKKEDPGQITNAPDYSILDMSKTEEEKFLVSVPDFVMNAWEKLQMPTEVGKVRVEHYGPGKPPKMIVTLSSNIEYEVPYEMIPQFDIRLNQQSQTLLKTQYAFSSRPDTGFVRMVGHVSGIGNMVTKDSQKMADVINLIKSKKEIPKEVKKDKKAKKIVSFDTQPVKVHKVAPRTREFKDRTMTKSIDELQQEIIELFGRQPEINIKDIVRSVNQQQSRVQQALADIADFDEKEKVYRLKEHLQL